MSFSILHVTICLCFLAATQAYPSATLIDSAFPSTPTDSAPVVKNAAHIFNAIHSSMRQWGSSLNHNGMSFFLGYIPAGTELYHGRGDNETIKGLEWLAFEPEHALNFARQWRRPRPGEPGSEPPEGPPTGSGRHHEEFRDVSTKWLVGGDPRAALSGYDIQLRPHHHPERQLQHPLGDEDSNEAVSEPPEMAQGWLHTFRMKFDLPIIYIDGMSAGKTSKGTMDSQAYVLQLHDADEEPRGPFDDMSRARSMCEIGANQWNSRIQGFVRMEHGFELILCDFEKSADLVEVKRALPGSALHDQDAAYLQYEFMKAISARYHGIGEERVKLNYDSMVTAYALDVDLFASSSSLLPGNEQLPRLENVSVVQREAMFTELSDTILIEEAQVTKTNWQSIADMIVTRYSDILYHLAFDDSLTNKTEIDGVIHLLMRPFIDSDERDFTKEVERCAGHFLPRDHSNSTAAQAINHVSKVMCTTFLSVLELAPESSSPNAFDYTRQALQDLVHYLKWTCWKDCRPGCMHNEVCYTAIWPFGDTIDHEKPSCMNGTAMLGRGGYWEAFGPPRGDKDRKGKNLALTHG